MAARRPPRDQVKPAAAKAPVRLLAQPLTDVECDSKGARGRFVTSGLCLPVPSRALTAW